MTKVVTIALRHPTEPDIYLHGLRTDNHRWAMPGGHVKPGETNDEAAARELEEETGVKGIKLEHAHQQHYGDLDVHLYVAQYPGTELTADDDPDKEFVTFKFLNPLSHGNMHIPAKRNILAQWMDRDVKTHGLIEPVRKGQGEGYTLSHKIEPHHTFEDEKNLHVYAHAPDGTVIGHAQFQYGNGGKSLMSESTVVDPGHRRKGIASAMYQHAENISGAKVRPSDTRTDEARALWGQPNRLFGKALGKIKVEPFVVDPKAFDPRKHDFIVRAMSKGKPVGILAVTHTKQGLMPFNFEVNRMYRRKGYGTAMAAHAEKIAGKKIVRSPDMTRDAVAWADKFMGPAPIKKSKEQVKVAVVALYDKNFILVGKRNKNGKWALPGGRFEDDETKEDVVIRELREEAGIRLKKENLHFAGSRNIKDKKVYVFLAPYPGGEPSTDNDPDEEFSEWQWIRCSEGKAPDWIFDEELNPPTQAAFDELHLSKMEELFKKQNTIGGALSVDGPATLMNRVEDKYLVRRDKLDEITSALKEKLHDGDPDTAVRFNVNKTIYLDNRDLDALRDNMESRRPRFKVRIRQYSPTGEQWEDVAYVELKIKPKDGITKKVRVRIPASMIDQICEGSIIRVDENLEKLNVDTTRDVLWRRVAVINTVLEKYGFRKQVVVSYQRRAYSGGKIRVTIDDNIRFCDAREIPSDILDLVTDSKYFKSWYKCHTKVRKDDYLILEVKHEDDTPIWLKGLLKNVDAKHVSFSKYCGAMAAYLSGGKNNGEITVDRKIDASSVLADIEGYDVIGKAEGEMPTTSLYYPVTIGSHGRSNLMIKDFGPAAEPFHETIEQIGDQHKLNHPIDERNMVFVPHKIKNLKGDVEHVLAVHGAPPKIDEMRMALLDVGPKSSRASMHIPISKDDFDRLSKLGNALTAGQAGIKLHPAELRHGGTVIRTW